MPTPKPKIVEAWSYSRLTQYETCPGKTLFGVIKRIKEPTNAPMQRGKKIHEIAQHYTEGRGSIKIPTELKLFKEEFRELRGDYAQGIVVTEGEWAFNKTWNQVEWMSPKCRVRIKVDAAYKNGAIIIDHKTGRIRPEHMDQLKLYAMGAFLLNPELLETTAQLWYLDEGEIRENTIDRRQLPNLKKYWLKRVKPLLSDRTFKPIKSNACKWCYYSQHKHGDCEVG